jgi:hypothetical protein
MDSKGCSVGIAILTSFLASVFWAGIVLFIAARVRKATAKPFIGTYDMCDLVTQVPRGGTVTVDYSDSWWKNLIGPTPVLMVSAEHGTGNTARTEDWNGAVEVLGLSDLASGFYRHPNREGGTLRFILSRGNSQITEHGIPHDPNKYPPFVKLLKRRQ